MALKEKWKAIPWKWAAPALIALVAVGAVAYGALPLAASSEESTTVYKETTVERGDITVGVTESGTATIDAESVSFGYDATVTEVYVKAGQTVQEGDTLAKLDISDLADELKSAQLSLQKAQTELEQAKIDQQLSLINAELDYQTNSNLTETAQYTYDATIEELEYEVATYANTIDDLEDQISDYKKIKKGDATSEKEIADLEEAMEAAKAEWEAALAEGSGKTEVEIEELKSAYEKAKSRYETAVEAYEEKLDSADDKIESLQSELDAAQLKYRSAVSTLKTQELQAQADLEADLVTGENAQTLYDIEVAQLSNNVTSAEISVQEAQLKLKELQQYGTDGLLKAPCSGLVMSVSYKAGDEVTASSAVVTIANSENVYVNVSIAQEDISSIELGSPVNVMLNAYEYKFTGVVDSISVTPARTNASTVSYDVTVKLEGDTSVVYEGMTGDVTFVTKEITDVLYVSNKAVTAENGKSYVKIKDENGEAQQVEVTTGFSDGKNVEIVSGLSEGDTVLIESQVRSK